MDQDQPGDGSSKGFTWTQICGLLGGLFGLAVGFGNVQDWQNGPRTAGNLVGSVLLFWLIGTVIGRFTSSSGQTIDTTRTENAAERLRRRRSKPKDENVS